MTVPPIIPANTAIQTFRDNGYKNTASAISELIDNSIDAKAKNIQILVFEKTVTKSNRPQKQISQIKKLRPIIKKLQKTKLVFKTLYQCYLPFIKKT